MGNDEPTVTAPARVWLGTAVLAALTIAITTGFGTGDHAVAGDAHPAARTDDSLSAREAESTGSSPPVAEPDAPRPAPSTTSPPPVTAGPLMVPNPEAGDLRFDDGADVLPADYEPPPAAATVLDIAYGSGPAQRLDLHLPAGSPAPIVLYLHGGGWIAGEKELVPDMVLRFVERGYAVASVDYGLAPEHPFPAPVTDVKLAIRWLKAYAEREGTVDGNRIVLFGASAGGHLAAFVAATPGEYEPADLTPEQARFDSTVAGVVSVVGPTDLVRLYDHPNPWARPLTSAFVGCDPCNGRELDAASVGGRLQGDVPPAYWAYGTEDPLVEVHSQGTAIAVAWAARGGAARSWLDLVDGAGHNLDESLVNQRALEAFVDFAVGAR